MNLLQCFIENKKLKCVKPNQKTSQWKKKLGANCNPFTAFNNNKKSRNYKS